MSDPAKPSDVAEAPAGGDQIRTIARRYEIDRYLSSLLAPYAARDDLIVLAAFSGELHRLGETVSDPMLGEIKLQWWRDALEHGGRGERTGHPVADALNVVMKRYRLPHERLMDMLDVHAHRLYADPPADDDALALELDLTEGVLFAFATRVLGCEQTPLHARAIQSAGRAFGLMRMARQMAASLSRGREPFPPKTHDSLGVSAHDRRAELTEIAAICRGHIGDLRAALAELGDQRSAVMTAMLPVAVVEPYLKALQRRDHDPLRDIADIAPLTRVARIAMAHLKRRL